MDRPYLFLAGEFRATMPAVFRREKWQHTMAAKKLFHNRHTNTIKRDNFQESIKGVIYFNRTDDYNLELHNLNIIIESDIPCWPNPKTLLEMSSRHETLKKCMPYIDHEIIQGEHRELSKLTFWPSDHLVLKVGEDHRGQNKFLINPKLDFPDFDGIATIEPFFIGESCRVLFIGDKTFGIKYFNPTSWIKNSCGADIEIFDPPQHMINHAKLIHNLFGLEISGSDYILEPNGKFHFLEVNQYPGLDASDEINAAAQSFFGEKMEEVENGITYN